MNAILLAAALAAAPPAEAPPEPDPNMLVSWSYEESELSLTPKASFAVIRADGTATYESGKTDTFSGEPPVVLSDEPATVSFKRLEVLWHGWATDEDFELGRRRESDGVEIVKAVEEAPAEQAESTVTDWRVSEDATRRAEESAEWLREARMAFAAAREREANERHVKRVFRDAARPRGPDIIFSPFDGQFNVRLSRGGVTREELIARRALGYHDDPRR